MCKVNRLSDLVLQFHYGDFISLTFKPCAQPIMCGKEESGNSSVLPLSSVYMSLCTDQAQMVAAKEFCT